jgi:hypothetical protein
MTVEATSELDSILEQRMTINTGILLGEVEKSNKCSLTSGDCRDVATACKRVRADHRYLRRSGCERNSRRCCTRSAASDC